MVGSEGTGRTRRVWHSLSWMAWGPLKLTQALSCCHDQLTHALGVASAEVLGTAGSTAQALPALLGEAALLFVQPGRAARNASENGLTGASL